MEISNIMNESKSLLPDRYYPFPEFKCVPNDLASFHVYNNKLRRSGLPEARISTSIKEDRITVKNGRRIERMSLFEFLIGFLSSPSYCLSDEDVDSPNGLINFSFDILYAVLKPKSAVKLLNRLYDNMTCMGIQTVEVGNLILDKSDRGWKLVGYNSDNSEVLYLPEFINEIGYPSFFGDEYLQKLVSFSKNLKIGANAFEACISLSEVLTPYGIKELSQWSFSGCRRLHRVDLSDSLSRIPEGCFYDAGLPKIKWPSNLREIGADAFHYNYGMTKLRIADLPHFRKIGDVAFCESNLYKITMENLPEFSEIGENAFAGCRSLEEVRFRNTPKLGEINEEVFSGCVRLREINLQKPKKNRK